MIGHPKRPAFHETGHLVALYLLTGSLTSTRQEKGKREPVSIQTVDGYRQIFNEVCIGIAGGAAERVYGGLGGLPKETMSDDIDLLYTFALYDWNLEFKDTRNGFRSCPVLANMIKTASYFIIGLFRSSDLILKFHAVADYMIENDLVQDMYLGLPDNVVGVKHDIRKILNSKDLVL